MVASHTAVPLGTANQRSLFASARESKWLVRATPTHKTLPLGKGHTQIAHVAYLKAGCILRGNLVPAISKHLKAFLYGWLPLSDAAGIFFCCLTMHEPLASFIAIKPCTNFRNT